MKSHLTKDLLLLAVDVTSFQVKLTDIWLTFPAVFHGILILLLNLHSIVFNSVR